VLAGTADLAALSRRAPKLAGFEGEALTLSGVELFQATWELGGLAPEAPFPPALAPTLPVLAVLSIRRGDSGPLGPFSVAELRLSCRSGVRPRQLLVASFAEGDAARAGQAERVRSEAREARLAHPVAAFVAVGDWTLPHIRFVSRADVPAFAGTERVSPH